MRNVAALMFIGLPLFPQSLVQKASKVAVKRENPYEGCERARLAGAKLFRQNCEPCHGENAKGNARRGTPPLATPLVHDAEPGTLFWILTNGSANHRMPSFAHLPEGQRWQIITYLKRL